jgi:phosphonopyruvate decarboxylase
MIEAESFCHVARLAGFRLYSGVPCSYVTSFINHVIDDPDLTYIGAANEGDAVAIATGSALAGAPAIVMMQNSGLGNAVSPLTSLNAVFRLPVLLIVTLRGEVGGPHDEPQHELMGAITTTMLETMMIAWDWFPTQESQVEAAIEKAVSHMDATGLPFCFVMKRDSVAPHALTSKPVVRRPVSGSAVTVPGAAASPEADGGAGSTGVSRRPSREEALRAIQRAVEPEDIVIATTGYTGRELYACDDRPNQLYLVGSMGCASGVGLGMAWARPDRRIVVIDGDGAMLMRLGSLATLAYERPANLVHVLLDNEAHESTGGQSTVSHSMDLAGVASSCGYPSVARLTTAEQLETMVRDRAPGLRFLSLKVRRGVSADLPRPRVGPPEVADRIKKTLTGTS